MDLHLRVATDAATERPNSRGKRWGTRRLVDTHEAFRDGWAIRPIRP